MIMEIKRLKIFTYGEASELNAKTLKKYFGWKEDAFFTFETL